MKQKAHIIGICGKASSAIATMLQGKSWIITGSDQGIYPPVSDYLKENSIEIFSPYNTSNVPNDIDMAIVAGNALIIDPQNPEVVKAKKLGVPVLNYPQVLQEFVVKENSIVVAGNFGKGTISGAIVHVLKKLGEDPSYMVGGEMLDCDESLVSSESHWSVMEGDEYPVPPLEGNTPRSKFFYYNPKYLILTSAEWDHYDKFETENDYIQNYIELVKTLPENGVLIANLDGKNIEKITPHANCRVITYSETRTEADFVSGDLNWSNAELFGKFNQSNLTAAYALLITLGFNADIVKQHLETYHGLVYRMQKMFSNDSRIVIRDLAHSPVKAEAALQAAHEKWPDWNIIAVFEIFSSSLKNNAVLPELQHRFDLADSVIIPKVDLVARIDRESQVTGKEIVEAIGTNATYMPKDEQILEYLSHIPDNTVVIFMSSGGLRGIPEAYLQSVETSHDT